MDLTSIFFSLVCSAILSGSLAVQNPQKSALEKISDPKEFKKVLKTKNNVMLCLISSEKLAASKLKILREVAEAVKGEGTLLVVECLGEGKKLCKKLKVSPQPLILRHYHNGEFHKTYDRKETVSSLVNFMRNPTGELPWEEEGENTHVVHVKDPTSLERLIKKETKPILVMFYAPWCGFCKTLKPEYKEAATELKDTHVLAAIDVYRPENAVVRVKYNISGFPTLLYFHNGRMQQTYEGRNKKEDIISFMKDPSSFVVPSKEPDWSETSENIVHLLSDNFKETLEQEKSALVMFYAPWCGHCKKMKPEYELAAAQMKKEKIEGILAAVDMTKDNKLSKEYGIKGFPTIKYFRNGEYQFDTPALREAKAILEFMKNPSAPPPPPEAEPAWEDVPSEVVHLNIENFKTFLKKKKHVLVMFYAPWCTHCKKVKPEFQEAAELAKDDPKMTFAALDCTEHPSLCQILGISGYPTLKYYSFFDQEEVDYSGGRTKKDFISFMKSKIEAAEYEKRKQEL